MTKDFQTFFDIYVRPSDGAHIDRESYEFRYAAAALLVACSKADFDEDPEEEKVIYEELFIERIASMIQLTKDDVSKAQEICKLE